MNSAEFFALHHPAGRISKELQLVAESDAVGWEYDSVHPDYSPGPVAPEEELCRPHTNPIHFASDGSEVTPAGFQEAATHGLSVDRLKHSSVEVSLEKADSRAKAFNEKRSIGAPERTVLGYSVFKTLELRQLTAIVSLGSTQRRTHGVYDTALEDAPEHADVCFIAPNPNSQLGRSARHELYRIGNQNYKPR